MDIQKTQRMNLMIKELTKSGRITSFDEALDAASNLYDDALPPSYSQPSPNQKKDIKTKSSVGVSREDLKKEIQKDIQNYIKSNNEGIARELRKVWDYIKFIESNYKKQIKELQEKLKEKSQIQKTLKTETTATTVSPKRVSLEKYFYFGNK